MLYGIMEAALNFWQLACSYLSCSCNEVEGDSKRMDAVGFDCK